MEGYSLYLDSRLAEPKSANLFIQASWVADCEFQSRGNRFKGSCVNKRIE
jgi:hypothetical protein